MGLPEGQMGNSEVGHLNLGAGRVVPQDLVRISQSIQSGEFYQLPPLVELCARLRQTGGTLHLVGLLGPGGVHALDRHLLACVELGVRHRVPAIAIHGFLDGRDSPPTLGAEVVRTLLQDMRRIAGSRVDVASLTGATTGWTATGAGTAPSWRTTRWSTASARRWSIRCWRFRPPTSGARPTSSSSPLVHHRNGRPVATMRDGDGVLFFNYRSDRMRQIVARARAGRASTGSTSATAPRSPASR